MITYVDSSSWIELIVEEAGSDLAELMWQSADSQSADSLAPARLIVVEAHAALAAAARSQQLSADQLDASTPELAAFVGDLHLVEVTEELVDAAAELAEVEALRDDDAVHLATALFARATVPTSADDALCDAAGRRGMHVADPLHP